MQDLWSQQDLTKELIRFNDWCKVCVTDLTQIFEVHVGFRDHINLFKLVVKFARLLNAPAAHAIARNV